MGICNDLMLEIQFYNFRSDLPYLRKPLVENSDQQAFLGYIINLFNKPDFWGFSPSTFFCY